MDLSTIRSASDVYLFFECIFLMWAIGTQKLITASVIAVGLIAYKITVEVITRKMTVISLPGRLFLSSGAALFASLFFLLGSFCMVEIFLTDARAQISSLILLGIGWILVVLLLFAIRYHFVKKSGYRTSKKGERKGAFWGSFFVFCAALGSTLARVCAKYLSQNTAVMITILLFFFLSAAFAIGIPHCLVGYLIIKYSIPGETLEIQKKPKRIVSVILGNCVRIIGVVFAIWIGITIRQAH